MASVDELVRATGRTKQALITEFVEGAVATATAATTTAAATATTRDTTSPAQPLTPESEICDLDEIAALLRVSPDQVLTRIGDGGLPGRLFGDDWRFSRDAVMRWLDGADRPVRAPGFSR